MLDHAAREVVQPAGIEVPRQAAEILTQAQNLADQLRAEAQADAEAMRAELARNRDLNDNLVRTSAEKQAQVEAAVATATARAGPSNRYRQLCTSLVARSLCP